MAAPKGEGQVQVGLKLPAQTVRRLDALVENGTYGSRSLVIKDAIDRLLDADRARAETDRAIREGLLSGRYDAEIEMQVRKILGQVVSTNNVHRSDELSS